MKGISNGVKLIVGLGNPGLRYKNTRHNIGFLTIEILAKELGLSFKRDSTTHSFLAKAKTLRNEFFLAKPDTFMNLSGKSVNSLVKKYKIKHKDILIICDDLNLEPGQIKLKTQGAAGGHNGLSSIIESLKTKEFNRLKIGIGRPRHAENFSDFVLEEFSAHEKKEILSAIEEANFCILAWIEKGTDFAMNKFNKR